MQKNEVKLNLVNQSKLTFLEFEKKKDYYEIKIISNNKTMHTANKEKSKKKKQKKYYKHVHVHVDILHIIIKMYLPVIKKKKLNIKKKNCTMQSLLS